MHTAVMGRQGNRRGRAGLRCLCLVWRRASVCHRVLVCAHDVLVCAWYAVEYL